MTTDTPQHDDNYDLPKFLEINKVTRKNAEQGWEHEHFADCTNTCWCWVPPLADFNYPLEGQTAHALLLVLDPLRQLDELRPAPNGWDDDEKTTWRHFDRRAHALAVLIAKRARAAVLELPVPYPVLTRAFNGDEGNGLQELRWRLEEALRDIDVADGRLVAQDVEWTIRIADAWAAATKGA